MLEVSHELVTSTTSNTPVPCHNNSITQPDKKTFTIHWPLVALFAAARSSPERSATSELRCVICRAWLHF